MTTTSTHRRVEDRVLQGARILVAEDDESFRGFVTQALTWSGYRVETGTDGDDVLARLERLEGQGRLPALLLTDVRMPKTDGLSLLREARRRWPNLPVVLMTCFGDHEVLREALKIGCNGFLDKPFVASELEAVVQKVLDDHHRLQVSIGGIERPSWKTRSGRFRLPEERERIGDHEIQEEIARGAMGVVYKARQVDLDRVVALKVTQEGAGGGAFLREARVMARVRHPNIAIVYETGIEEGIEYFTMEFIAGCSLAARLREGPLTPRAAVDVLGPVADGLAHVHEHEILHRDLKPSNILIDADERPVLVDFGISTEKRTQSDIPAGYLEGTLNYMAPEYAGGDEYDEQCDIYSLGVVLYEALAGRGVLPHWQPPVAPEVLALGPHMLLTQFSSAGYVPIESRASEVPPALAEVVRRAVAPDRSVRYRTVSDLAEALRSSLEV